MKKVLLLAGLAVFIKTVAYARITGTQPSSPDTVCFGQQGLELCQDASANWVPTSDGVGALGTTSLRFSSMNVYGTSILNGSSTHGTVGTINTPGTGNSTFPTSLGIVGLLGFTKSQIGSGTAAAGVYASTTIPVLSTLQVLLSSGVGTTTLQSVPNISTTTTFGGATAVPNGTLLVLTSTSSASGVMFQDKDTLTGSALQLGAATRTVSADKVLVLIFNSTTGFWDEVAYGNN